MSVGQGGSIVIIGAGMCGGNAAVTLREEGHQGRVILIGDEPETPFGRPPLSKTYLRGEEDLTAWLVRQPAWYDQNNIERRQARATAIDTGAKEIVLEAAGERIAYDQALIATGGSAQHLPVPGAELAGVLSLRTVADCEAIKLRALPGSHAVVVGMGFIGSEVAASLRQLGVDVTAVVTGAGPLARVLGDAVGAVMGEIHREHGVELVDDRVVAFAGDGRVEHVITEGGARLGCDFAVVGAGIDPGVAIALNSGIPTDNGVLVDERCRAAAADVYAGGDVANQLHPVFGRVRVEHYNSAERQGRAVARSMLGDAAPFADIHSFWSDQYEHAIEYVGHAARWDRFVVRGSLEDRRFLGFYLDSGRVAAVMGLNRGGDPELDEDSELAVAKDLVRARATVSAALLASEADDLRVLLPQLRS